MNRRKFLQGAAAFGFTVIVLKEFGTESSYPTDGNRLAENEPREPTKSWQDRQQEFVTRQA